MVLQRKLRIFMKRRHDGSVVKVVREHYLRGDIPCGHPSCGVCTIETGRPRLSERPTLTTVLCPYPHYIIPDTNVVIAAVRYSDDICVIGWFNLWAMV